MIMGDMIVFMTVYICFVAVGCFVAVMITMIVVMVVVAHDDMML